MMFDIMGFQWGYPKWVHYLGCEMTWIDTPSRDTYDEVGVGSLCYPTLSQLATGCIDEGSACSISIRRIP